MSTARSWSAYGPSTEVGLPLDDGPMVPRLWELHHEGGTGLTLAVEAVVGTQAGSQPLTEDLLIRVRGTPNNSGMTDEWGLGGLHVPSNAVHLVKLQVNFVEPIF